MAGENVIKNKIVLEGEAKYKKEMAEISRVLKENKAAAKAAAAEYDAAEGSMTAMYRQGDALERVLETQAEALRLMNEQLDKTEAAYGKNSREATELRTRINNMRAEMARTETQVRQFYQRMDDAADGMQDSVQAADRAGQALTELGADARGAEGDVGSLAAQLADLTGIDLGKLGIAGVTAGAVGAVKQGMELGTEQTQARGQIAAYTGKTGAELDALEDIGQAVYNEGFGESLKEASQSVAVIHTYTGALNDELQESTQTAYRLADVFGMDIPESARTAQQLMTVFGISSRDAYALMAAGAQEGADKNGNLLDTLNEYAPYFAMAGKSAEEFMGTLTAGAANGVYDIDKIGDAMKEFTLRIGDGSETTKEALLSLGIEATDLPAKFAVGGETASAAFDLVIDALKGIEDPLARTQAGIALFGTQWEDSGGAVLDIFDAISGGATDATGSIDALNETRLDDLDVQLDRVVRRVEGAAGEFFQPLSEGAAHALGAIADGMDSGEMLEGMGKAVLELVDGLHEMIDPVFEELGTSIEEKTGELSEKVSEGFFGEAQEADTAAEADKTAGRWIDTLTGSVDEAAQNADPSTAIQDMLEGMLPDTSVLSESMKTYAQNHKDAVIEQMETAYGQESDEDFEAWKRFQAAMIESAYEDNMADAGELGTDTADSAMQAIEDAEPEMETTGEEFGESGVDGIEDGFEGMYDAGVDAADGAISGMNTGLSRAYEAGAALGGAFLRGYRAKMMIRSPSRVMYDAAGDTVDGALERFKEDRQRLYAAAADLGDAVAMGYSESGSGYAMDAGGAGGMAAQELAGVLIQALSGLGLYCNGERVGELTEMGASRATRNRLMATVRGQSSAAKGW